MTCFCFSNEVLSLVTLSMICKIAFYAPRPVNLCSSLPQRTRSLQKHWELQLYCQVLLQGPGPGTGSPCLWGSHWRGALRSVGGRASEDRPGTSCPLPGSTDSGLLHTAARDRGSLCGPCTPDWNMLSTYLAYGNVYKAYKCIIALSVYIYFKIRRNFQGWYENEWKFYFYPLLPPILQWHILHTPGYVYNPLCNSGFKRQIYLTQISDHTSPPPHPWVRCAF